MGNVIDMMYGADNCDASLLENVSLQFITFGATKLRGLYPDPDGTEADALCRLVKQTLDAKLSNIAPVLSTTVYLPLNLPLLLLQCPKKFVGDPVSSIRAYEMLKQFMAKEGPLTLFMQTSLCYHLRSPKVCAVFSEQDFAKFLFSLSVHLRVATVNPGEMVGVLAAASVGHPCTQLTLSNFHSAGVAEKNGTLGVPRIKEIIDARRNILTPVTTIYINSPFNNNRQMLKVYAERLVYTVLADIVIKTDILLEPDIHDTASESEVDQFLCQLARHTIDPDDYPGYSKYVIRMELDKTMLMRKEFTIRDVRTVLRQFLGDGKHYILQTSETNMKTWVLRLRMAGMADMHKHLQNQGHSSTEFDKNMAHSFLDHLGDTVVICGIPGLSACSVDEHHFTVVDPDTLTVTQSSEWYIVATGVNMRGLWREPMISWERTTSNDVFEMQEILGIEAAAVMLFHEIRTVLSFDGAYVNDRHMIMICNAMLRLGNIMPLNRHGLNKLPSGPLVKSTFEMSAEIFFEAGAFAEHNPLNSVSDNLMLGQRIPGGTGKMDLLIQPDYLKNIKTHRQTEKAKITVVRTYYSNYLSKQVQAKPPKCTSPVALAFSPKPQNINKSFPAYTYGATSPKCNATSPTYEYNATSPTYNATSPTYSATSPTYQYSAESPMYQTSPTSKDLWEPMSTTALRPMVPLELPHPVVNVNNLFQDSFQTSVAYSSSTSSSTSASALLWPENSDVYRFAQNNGIGFAHTRYAPSSPALQRNPSYEYQPSSPRILLAQKTDTSQNSNSITVAQLESIRSALDGITPQEPSPMDTNEDEAKEGDDGLYDPKSGVLRLNELEKLMADFSDNI
jgi:DNA-directed RNA polymerase II subunit RPB1